MVHGEEVQLETAGFSDIHDITGEVQAIVARSGARSGIVSVFVIGSTASVSTIEFEPALVADMRERLETFAPHDMATRHGATWGDDNGFSHLRATFMGPGITAAFTGGKLILGTWQQIVVIDHDNRPRSRRIHVQVVGE
jgi:secondary thiamine-phosphate synthase enzyme